MGWRIPRCAPALFLALLSAAGWGQASAVSPTADTPQKPEAPRPVVVNIQAFCKTIATSEAHAEALQTACVTALRVSQAMPNYLCDMVVEKTAGFRGTMSRFPFQKVTARARFVDGKDTYEDLKVNGKPVTKPNALLEGTWSDGEFGMNLLLVFKPANETEFHFLGEKKLKHTDAYEFSFAVAKEKNSSWRWTWDNHSIFPGYAGKIWIAVADSRILRVDVNSTDGIAKETPMQFSEGKTDFSLVDFHDGTGYMLPAKVELRSLLHGNREYRQELKFRDCRKFAATSRIVSDPAK